MKEQRTSVQLDDWAVMPNPRTGNFDKLRAGSLLVGRVSGHPRFQEGTFIFSSPVMYIDTETRTVETKNTTYLLGKVSVAYKSWSREQATLAA